MLEPLESLARNAKSAPILAKSFMQPVKVVLTLWECEGSQAKSRGGGRRRTLFSLINVMKQ